MIRNQSGVEIKIPDWKPPFNRKVVRERDIVIKKYRVKKRPDQVVNMMAQEQFDLGSMRQNETLMPVLVTVLLEVDGNKVIYPMIPQVGKGYAPGQWFRSEMEWDDEEPRFKEVMGRFLAEKQYVLEDKSSWFTGVGDLNLKQLNGKSVI